MEFSLILNKEEQQPAVTREAHTCLQFHNGEPEHPFMDVRVGFRSDINYEVVAKIARCTCMSQENGVRMCELFVKYSSLFYSVHILGRELAGLEGLVFRYLRLPTQPPNPREGYNIFERDWEKNLTKTIQKIASYLQPSHHEKQEALIDKLVNEAGIREEESRQLIQDLFNHQVSILHHPRPVATGNEPPTAVPRISEQQTAVHDGISPISNRLNFGSDNKDASFKETVLQVKTAVGSPLAITPAGPGVIAVWYKNRIVKKYWSESHKNIPEMLYDGDPALESIMSGNGKYLINAASMDLFFWSAETMQSIIPEGGYQKPSDRPYCSVLKSIGVAEESYFAVSGAHGLVQTYSIKGDNGVTQVNSQSYRGLESLVALYGVNISNEYVVAGNTSGKVHFWKRDNPNEVLQTFSNPVKKSVFSIDQCSENPHVWVAAGKDSVVRYDLRSEEGVIINKHEEVKREKSKEFTSVRWDEGGLLELVRSDGLYWLDPRKPKDYVKKWEPSLADQKDLYLQHVLYQGANHWTVLLGKKKQKNGTAKIYNISI